MAFIAGCALSGGPFGGLVVARLARLGSGHSFVWASVACIAKCHFHGSRVGVESTIVALLTFDALGLSAVGLVIAGLARQSFARAQWAVETVRALMTVIRGTCIAEAAFRA